MKCRHCGNDIRVEALPYTNSYADWATSDPMLDHPWYCDANPDDGKRHEPADLYEGAFIKFVPRPGQPGHSTIVVDVIQKSTGHREAVIKWKGRRGYSLWPEPGTVFGPTCLGDVMRVISSLNKAHKEGKR